MKQEYPSNGIVVREAMPLDLPRILVVVEQAFRSRVEVELVRMIHESPNFVSELSLVAERGREIIGHVMCSYADLQDSSTRHRILTLSPVSVAPKFQRKGVGSALVRAVLRVADLRGERLVCLEGSPKYYGQLGFQDSRESGIHFDLPDWAPRNAGQIYKLKNFDPSLRGRVAYPPAFEVAERLRSEVTEVHDP